jgi:hypothetical protein
MMIIEHYPNPNTVSEVKTTHISYEPGKQAGDMANGHGLNFNQHWAKKMNLQLHIFVERDRLVQDAARKVTFSKNATVWPVNEADYKKDGPCRVLDVTRSYRDWPEEDFPWVDGNPIYVVEAYSVTNKFSVFRSTAAYFTDIKPTFVIDAEEISNV